MAASQPLYESPWFWIAATVLGGTMLWNAVKRAEGQSSDSDSPRPRGKGPGKPPQTIEPRIRNPKPQPRPRGKENGKLPQTIKPRIPKPKPQPTPGVILRYPAAGGDPVLSVPGSKPQTLGCHTDLNIRACTGYNANRAYRALASYNRGVSQQNWTLTVELPTTVPDRNAITEQFEKSATDWNTTEQRTGQRPIRLLILEPQTTQGTIPVIPAMPPRLAWAR